MSTTRHGHLICSLTLHDLERIKKVPQILTRVKKVLKNARGMNALNAEFCTHALHTRLHIQCRHYQRWQGAEQKSRDSRRTEVTRRL